MLHGSYKFDLCCVNLQNMESLRIFVVSLVSSDGLLPVSLRYVSICALYRILPAH